MDELVVEGEDLRPVGGAYVAGGGVHSATVSGRLRSTSSYARPVRTSSWFRSIAETLTHRPHMTRKARSDFRHDDARRSLCELRSVTSSGRRTPADPSSAGLTFAAGPLGAAGEETSMSPSARRLAWNS